MEGSRGESGGGLSCRQNSRSGMRGTPGQERFKQRKVKGSETQKEQGADFS